MLALAGCSDLPGVIVPGGVTLPAEGSEDAGAVQSLGARFAHGLVSLEDAAALACRACGTPGGGCQFLGTAATAQVVAEALGMALPHSALAPSGEPVWLDMARRSALALMRLAARGLPLARMLTNEAVENAMLAHAAFGGSTNLLLHLPAIAHAAGLRVPTVADWQRVNRAAPRLVDALPNGPRNHPTVRVFLAGGVPEVMLHLRRMGLLNRSVLTATGETLDHDLDWWEASERRRRVRERLRETDGVDAGRRDHGPGRGAPPRAGREPPRSSRVGNLAPGRLGRQGDGDRSVGRRRTTSTATAGPRASSPPRPRRSPRSRDSVEPQSRARRRARARGSRARSAPAWRRPTRSPRRSSSCRGASRSRC